MVDFARLAQTAKRLIEANGRPIKMVKLSETAANPSEPWKGPSGDPDLLPLTGVFITPGTVSSFGLAGLGEATKLEELIAVSEQVIITFPGENDLREYTKVRDNEVDWGIEAIQVLRPAAITMIAYIGVRR